MNDLWLGCYRLGPRDWMHGMHGDHRDWGPVFRRSVDRSEEEGKAKRCLSGSRQGGTDVQAAVWSQWRVRVDRHGCRRIQQTKKNDILTKALRILCPVSASLFPSSCSNARCFSLRVFGSPILVNAYSIPPRPPFRVSFVSFKDSPTSHAMSNS